MKIKPSFCRYILHGYFAATVLVVISLFLPDTFINDILGFLGPNSVRICYDAIVTDRNVFAVLWFLGYSLVVAIAYFVSLVVGTNYTPFGVIIGTDALVELALCTRYFEGGRLGRGIFSVVDAIFGIALSLVCIIASRRGKATQFGAF
ncbi:MAG: hypothetical protein SOY32_01185 [Candidatus Faecousia sp.]|nr:hypothetical protein [Clostridiales bacterium]MDD7652341.1 hypothetical protein [Bacillota bacterium]MDY4219020.1 hypothetical protein [Candidatus Faecousia sp.]